METTTLNLKGKCLKLDDSHGLIITENEGELSIRIIQVEIDLSRQLNALAGQVIFELTYSNGSFEAHGNYIPVEHLAVVTELLEEYRLKGTVGNAGLEEANKI